MSCWIFFVRYWSESCRQYNHIYQLICNQYFILIFGIHIIILFVTSILLQICILLQSSQTLIFMWFRTWYESTWWICNTILSWWKKLIGINLSYSQNNKLTFLYARKNMQKCYFIIKCNNSIYVCVSIQMGWY